MLFILRDAACVISDIVKRRSIRVGSRSKQFARTFIISGSFRRSLSAVRQMASCK
jgi:hypothetical protein